MAQTSKERRQAWDVANMTSISVKLANDRDGELIAFWRSLDNKADTFRRMLQREMDDQRKGK